MVSQLTAVELAEKLRSKEMSVHDALDCSHDRISKIDSDYRAFLTLCEESARHDADAAQAMIDSGDGGALTGVPLAVKDNMSTAGIPTTCASKILEGYVPPFDATVIERARSHGMVIVAVNAIVSVKKPASGTAVSEPPEYRTAAWLRGGLPFALTSGLNVLGASLGVLMLGPMRGPAETGVFGVAMAAAGVGLWLFVYRWPLGDDRQ